jgi:hypothetical protein
MRFVKSAKFVGVSDARVTLDCSGGLQCVVHVLTESICRVVFVQDGALRAPKTYSILPQLRPVESSTGPAEAGVEVKQPDGNSQSTRYLSFLKLVSFQGQSDSHPRSRMLSTSKVVRIASLNSRVPRERRCSEGGSDIGFPLHSKGMRCLSMW